MKNYVLNLNNFKSLLACRPLLGGDLAPMKGCDAWECCVYWEGSPEHQECCKKHGCCPFCERVSSGGYGGWAGVSAKVFTDLMTFIM